MEINDQAMGMPVARKIGQAEIRKAQEIFQKYKKAKTNLDERITSNEEWYRLRHWGKIGSKAEDKPVSAHLLNCILNKHADAMDNYPAPSVLPREEMDKIEAKTLSSILPVIMEQNEFEQTYSDLNYDKAKSGTGVYGVFWDSSKLNGLGDISITRVDVLSLAWEPGIRDIQKSRNLFYYEAVDNEALEASYPQLKGKLGGNLLDVKQYNYDDTVDTTEKSVVVDWYYKKTVPSVNAVGVTVPKTVLHYVKFVGDEVLYASEDDPALAERGFYDHGLYPFEFDVLFPCEGTPAGFGYIDIGKSAQEYIDRGNRAIMRNMLAGAKPRVYATNGSGLNEEEFCDTEKDVVHVNSLADAVQPVEHKPLNPIYVQVIDNKINELKETTGNRDVSTGGTTSGATAASAIAAMQEAGSKLSRDSNKGAYRAFKQVCLMVIELIRQFYDVPRMFRILGQNGTEEYVQYSNANIAMNQGLGVDMNMRKPLFDVEVAVSKASPYSKLSQNEMALQFYGAGFFNPQLADQSLACLEMMDFDHKDMIMQRIAQNGTMYQQMQMLMQVLASIGIDPMMVLQGQMPMPGAAPDGRVNAGKTENLGGKASESSVTENARKRVSNSTAPA